MEERKPLLEVKGLKQYFKGSHQFTVKAGIIKDFPVSRYGINPEVRRGSSHIGR